MKHWVYLIGAKDSNDSYQVGIYSKVRPTYFVNKMISQKEEAILVSEKELTFADNIQRFFMVLGWVSQAAIGASTHEKRKLGYIYVSDVEHYKRYGRSYGEMGMKWTP
jgi:hypothetical protein